MGFPGIEMLPVARPVAYAPTMGQPVMGQPVYGYPLPLQGPQQQQQQQQQQSRMPPTVAQSGAGATYAFPLAGATFPPGTVTVSVMHDPEATPAVKVSQSAPWQFADMCFAFTSCHVAQI